MADARIMYTNYKGETEWRWIRPEHFFYGTRPPWHSDPCHLIYAFDHVKKDYRVFALAGIKQWVELPSFGGGDQPQQALGDQAKLTMVQEIIQEWANAHGRYPLPDILGRLCKVLGVTPKPKPVEVEERLTNRAPPKTLALSHHAQDAVYERFRNSWTKEQLGAAVATADWLVVYSGLITDSIEVEEARNILLTWAYQRGHDRCWYYPDVFLKLCELFDTVPSNHPDLPPREEFEAGCKRYQDEQYGVKDVQLPDRNRTDG